MAINSITLYLYIFINAYAISHLSPFDFFHWKKLH